MSVKIELNRVSRTYQPGELVNAKITISTQEPIKAKELTCQTLCVRNIDDEGHHLSGFDQLVPISPEKIMWQADIKIPTPTKPITDGTTFNIQFKVPEDKNLTESLRGKYVSIDYVIVFSIKRGIFANDIVGNKTYFVVHPITGERPKSTPIDTQILTRVVKGPKVTITANVHLQTDVVSFLSPPNGYIEIVESDTPISQIQVSYQRTERLYIDRTNIKTFTSEVCRMQIVENDPPKNVKIPFNLEWLRILIFPDVETPMFTAKVALKVRIGFVTGSTASCTIPLKLIRDLPY